MAGGGGNLVYAALAVAGIDLVLGGRVRLAALPLGLGLVLKPNLAPLLLMFAVTRKWRALAWTLGAALALFFLPGLFYGMGAYLGAVPVLLLVLLVIQRRELGRLRRLVVCTAGFGLFVLLLALGKYAPLYRLQHLLPLVGSFRCPCRYLVLVSLCVAVLSAVAVAMLARRHQSDEKPPRLRTSPLWVVVGISAAAAEAATKWSA